MYKFILVNLYIKIFKKKDLHPVGISTRDQYPGISYYLIIIFGLPLTYAYATLWQSVAGNSTFRGIVYCNLGTPKTVISNFVTTRQIETPYSSPCKWS